MIQVVLYQNTNQKIAEAYKKWFPRVAPTETIDLEGLAEHMAAHNTPYSKGAILGMLTDAATCTKELLLAGKNVKFADIAIFSLGLIVKGGSPTKEEWSVAKYISGLRLRARGTGELTTKNLDTTIKRIDLATASSSSTGSGGTTDGTEDDSDKSNPSGGSASSGGTASGGGTSSGGTSSGDDGSSAGEDGESSGV